jgi:hypothetical protein
MIKYITAKKYGPKSNCQPVAQRDRQRRIFASFVGRDALLERDRFHHPMVADNQFSISRQA